MDFNIVKVIEYIKDNYQTITVKELAKNFYLSESHFCRTFKKKVGISPQDYLVGIKIEKSVENLVDSKDLILSSQIKGGYLSEGSFTNRIKKSMNLSPKTFTNEKMTIYKEFKDFENIEILEKAGESDLTVVLHSKEQINGMVFVGLFPKLLPNGPPVIGKVIQNYEYGAKIQFKNIPKGSFFLMACVIHRPFNLKSLFVHKDNFRGLVFSPFKFPGKYSTSLELRPPVFQDPPITLNLPFLYLYMMKNRSDEYRHEKSY